MGGLAAIIKPQVVHAPAVQDQFHLTPLAISPPSLVQVSPTDRSARRGRAQISIQTPLDARVTRPLPVDSDAFRAARAALPARFFEHETKRFVVLSDTNSQWTLNQAQLLERAHHQFNRFTRRLGRDPQPLRHKLVCILFDKREDYRAFARRYDDVTAEWISGYYSPKHDRVVFYNVTDKKAVSRDDRRIERAELALLNGPNQQQRLQYPVIDCDHSVTATRPMTAQDVATATNVHEAVHQLAFHTGLQSVYIQYPLWISEGLATAFETSTPKEAFGPDREYVPRRKQFDRLHANGALLPLRELVGLSRVPDNTTETIQVVYHQSYALFTWLNRRHRHELTAYLDLMRREPSGRPTTDRQVEIFEQAFGDIEQLERRWLTSEHPR